MTLNRQCWKYAHQSQLRRIISSYTLVLWIFAGNPEIEGRLKAVQTINIAHTGTVYCAWPRPVVSVVMKLLVVTFSQATMKRRIAIRKPGIGYFVGLSNNCARKLCKKVRLALNELRDRVNVYFHIVTIISLASLGRFSLCYGPCCLYVGQRMYINNGDNNRT